LGLGLGDNAPPPVNLPRFLLADDEDGGEYVLHLEEPRLLVRFQDNAGEVVLWFDDERDWGRRMEYAGRDPAVEMARLMRQVGDFYATGDYAP